MAKYRARPGYEVRITEKTVIFDYFGSFETEDDTVIKTLDTLVPAYLQRIDKPESVAPEVEQPEVNETKTEEQPSVRRKASAK